MPYYRWKAVTIDGSLIKGSQMALSQESLAATLFNTQMIALIESKESIFFKRKKPSEQARANLFAQLALFLKAGIRLPKAVLTLAHHYKEFPVMQLFLYQTAHNLEQGITLHQSITSSKKLFSSFEKQLLTIGEQSGILIGALTLLKHHLHNQASFKAQLKQALVMPCIVILTTIALFIGIVVGIVPQFIHFMQHCNQPISPELSTMMHIRTFFVSPLQLISALFAIWISILISSYIIKCLKHYPFMIFLKNNIPLYSTFKKKLFLMNFFYALGNMTAQGYTIHQAITLMSHSSVDDEEKKVLSALAEEISNGIRLSYALKSDTWFSYEDITLINTAEDTGSIATISSQIYEKYCLEIKALFVIIQTYAQPACILVIGLLIGSMIVTIYKPILSLATSI